MSRLCRLLFLGLALVASAIGLGCGGDDPKGPDMGGEEAARVAAAIEDLNDAVGNPKKLDAVFAKGAKPADVKKYAKLSFSIVGKPSVSGSTATAKVRVDGADGAKLGEAEWAFAKEGDKWKIKSAPLP